MPPGRRSCHDEHPNPLQSASSCKLCWLYCTNPVYNRFWGGNGSVNLSQVPCRHLGKDTKRTSAVWVVSWKGGVEGL